MKVSEVKTHNRQKTIRQKFFYNVTFSCCNLYYYQRGQYYKSKGNKKMKTKQLICLAAAILTLSACAQNDPQPERSETQQLSYRSSRTVSQNDTDGEMQGFSHDPVSGRMYCLISRTEYSGDSGTSEFDLISMMPDGSDEKIISLGSGSIDMICPDFAADGTGYYIYSDYSSDKPTLYLKKIGSDGSELSSIKLEDITAPGFENGYYPRGICAAPDGIYVNFYDKIAVFDYDGKLINAFSDNNMNNWTMLKGASGAIYTWSYGDNGFELHRIDISADEPAINVPLPFDSPVYDQSVYPVSGFGDTELFISDGMSLFSFDPDACTKEKVLDWVDSGISIMEVSKIFPSKNGFVCGGSAFRSEKPCVYSVYLTQKEQEEKTELILAGDNYSLDSFIRNQAVCFNRDSEKYKVTLKTYPDDDTQALNMDMLSGNVPDILMMGTDISSGIYASKGIFADLYEFIDKDSELSREDFLPNLLKACETDGHLYTFSDRFKVFTVLGKTSVFGDKQGITIEELKSISSGRPETAESFPGSCKNDILDYALYMSGDRFLDMQNGTCDFTCDYFIRLLEYANEYMNSVDMDSYFDDAFWGRYATMYADESALLLITFLADYSDIYAIEHDNFGEPVTAVGFPCESGFGSTFEMDTSFAICSSENEEGAWEFVRTLLLPEYQDYTDSFSVRTDSNAKKAETAMTHEPGRYRAPITLMGHMMLSSGSDADIGEPSEQDIGKVNRLISSVESIHKYNYTVTDIISEEASRYFSGAISSKEAAEAIQGRVMIYLSESY